MDVVLLHEKRTQEKAQEELGVLALINKLLTLTSNWALTKHHLLGTQWKSRNPILSVIFGSQILLMCLLQRFNCHFKFLHLTLVLITFTSTLFYFLPIAYLSSSYLLPLRFLLGTFSLWRHLCLSLWNKWGLVDRKRLLLA